MSRMKMLFADEINTISIYFQKVSRVLLSSTYPELKNEQYFEKLSYLHKKIQSELRQQKKEYPHFIYEQGFPYQALHTLGIFGVRSTETRFEDYELAKYINADDRILDIGCNCGFMLIYTSFRTGCCGKGIDINPYMINIGKYVAEFLGLSEKISLKSERYQDFIPEEKYTVVFSFAAHWTDDEQLRPDFIQYMESLYNLLTEEGILVFESHSSDVNNPEFYRNMDNLKRYFSWSGSKLLYNNQRELFIMHKNTPKSP